MAKKKNLEIVEIKLRIPKAVIDFIEKFERKDPAEFIIQNLIAIVLSDVENGSPTVLIDQYNLKPVFKEYGIFPSYYGE